jgi:Zn-dependent protease with chaperone function
VRGRYFDGATSQGRWLWCSVVAEGLRVADAQFSRQAPLSELRIAQSWGRAPTRIYFADGAVCELSNSEPTRRLLAELGLRAGVVDWLEGHWLSVGFVLGLFVALMLGVYGWGIPRATDLLADHFPAQWESNLGQGVLQQLEANRLFRESALERSEQDQVRADFADLTRTDAQPPYRLEFRKMGVPNAFTLPGGIIVVGDELVALARGDRDALMTVLAHELGHVKYRHGVRNLVHASLVSAWMAWYIGDVSSLVVIAGAGFADLRYSRMAESQADQYAWHFMHQRGISTHGAADLFRRLAHWRPEGAAAQTTPAGDGLSIPTYLSTHPDIGDRIALFESGSGAVRVP